MSTKSKPLCEKCERWKKATGVDTPSAAKRFIGKTLRELKKIKEMIQ